MAKSAGEAPTAQQSRKLHEAFNVQRLTTWIGAGALSLSGIFTAFAAKGAPMTIGVAPAANVRPDASIQNHVNDALNDRIVVRRVFLPPVRPPAAGVRAAQPAKAAGPAASAAARPAAASISTAAAAAPPPKPVAATGGSTPRH